MQLLSCLARSWRSWQRGLNSFMPSCGTRKIEQDLDNGRLDSLLEEAKRDFDSGRCESL